MKSLQFVSVFFFLLLMGCGEPSPYFLIEGNDDLKAMRFNNHVVMLKQQKLSLRLRYVGDGDVGGSFSSVISGNSKLVKINSSNDGLLALQAQDSTGFSTLSYTMSGLLETKNFNVHVSDKVEPANLIGEWREKPRLPFRCKGKNFYRATTQQFEMHCLYTILELRDDKTFTVRWVSELQSANPPSMMTYKGKWSLKEQYLTLDDPAGFDGSQRKSIGQLSWADGKLTLFHHLHTMNGEFAEFVKQKDPKKD
jgi:hypothetical protein